MMAGGTRAGRTKYLGLVSSVYPVVALQSRRPSQIGEILEDVFAGDTRDEAPVKTMEMLIQSECDPLPGTEPRQCGWR